VGEQRGNLQGGREARLQVEYLRANVARIGADDVLQHVLQGYLGLGLIGGRGLYRGLGSGDIGFDVGDALRP
jgi:hypothetical protein